MTLDELKEMVETTFNESVGDKFYSGGGKCDPSVFFDKSHGLHVQGSILINGARVCFDGVTVPVGGDMKAAIREHFKSILALLKD